MSDTTTGNIQEIPFSSEPSQEIFQPNPSVGHDTDRDTDHQNVGNVVDGSPEKKEHTRSTMAILFVLGFFAILFLCFAYAIMVGSSLRDLKETLVGVVGALSGILGFIVGYYYKATLEQ